MIAPPVPVASGSPLAIELSVSLQASAISAAQPRLQARLMRPGARGGWINGSLSWGALEPWQSRTASCREDHLDLARRFQAVHESRLTASGRYYYSRRDERTLDLSDWEGSQLWALLDQAIRLGVVFIHAGQAPDEIPRYRRGELTLDVTRGPGDDTGVRPVLTLEAPGELAGYEPLMFLGESGHGLLIAQRESIPEASQPELSGLRLRLVRLARDTPLELQRMLLAGGDLRIPEAELPIFATELAPALRNVAPIFSSDGSFSVPEVSAPELVLRASYDDGHITRAAWGWTYRVGGRAVEFALGVNGSGPGFRDLEAERAVLDRLDLSNTGLDVLGLLDGDGRPVPMPALLGGFDTVRFATEVLPALAESPEVALEVTGSQLDYRSVDESLEIGVGTVEIAGERDWFDLNVTITVEGRELRFAEVFAALARGEARMLLDDGAHFSLLAPELESLRALIEEARLLGDGGRPGTLRISRYQVSLWQELVGMGVVREQAEGWRRQVESLRALDAITPHEQPARLEATPRPYQLEGFQWLATLWELGLGGILADDMGLGKTLQALALICHALERRDRVSSPAGPPAGGRIAPFLVVAPTSVVSTWVTEAERFAPELAVRALTDTLLRAGVELADVTARADVVVTTYTLVRLDEDHYRGVEWSGVILDEAQAVKNHNAKTHAAVRRLPSPFKLAITGTPMENNLSELWALLSITAPGLFPDPAAFTEHYARPIERHGDGERLARLRRRIKPLVKRRTKELVAAELPAKQEQMLELDLHPRHRKLYDTHMQRERQRILGLLDDFDANRFTILTAITRMRQLSLHAGLVEDKHLKMPSAKLDALTEQLSDVIGGGHRALVFSQFTGFLALVRARLDAEGIRYCYLDGRTRRREKVIAEFKRGDAAAFLISLKAGGAGLNLTEADYCFLLDPWWNPAVEAQAIDRAHRIGQTRQVMVYRLVARHTIEQKVVALAQRKAALFSGVMDDGELFAGEITADDIRGLLS
ncbi:MAG: helicase [Acidobacteriota bacterium]|nr:helicase [Acidobacteriota bacterium]